MGSFRPHSPITPGQPTFSTHRGCYRFSFHLAFCSSNLLVSSGARCSRLLSWAAHSCFTCSGDLSLIHCRSQFRTTVSSTSIRSQRRHSLRCSTLSQPVAHFSSL